MKKLENYITSPFLTAANALRGKSKRHRVVAYVESYDDVFFWRSILSLVETPKTAFVVMLPSRNQGLERGKKAALMSALKDGVGPDLIACVDADYDYLKQGCNAMSEMVCSNPYVFHTYAYAIENLQCWAPSLHDVSVMVTLNDSADDFDFEAFLTRYSIIIYPLFLWSVLSARKPLQCNFQISEFLHVVKMGRISRANADQKLHVLAQKVHDRMRSLRKEVTSETYTQYELLGDELKKYGVTAEETYLYVQGHMLFNDVVMPLMISVCDSLVHQREHEISVQSKHHTQRENELACYENSIEGIASMLKKNTCYLRSPQVKRIISDLGRYVISAENLHNQPEHE